MSGKQCRPRSDAAKHGVEPGALLLLRPVHPNTKCKHGKAVQAERDVTKYLKESDWMNHDSGEFVWMNRHIKEFIWMNRRNEECPS